MREYEFVYVVQPDATPEREAEIHQRIDGVIDSTQGRLLLRDDWGKRRLAYEIKKFQKGHYFQVNYLGEGKEVSEIERLMRIDADVLRFLSVQASDEVGDIEARIVEAKVQGEQAAARRAEREKERALREEREKEREGQGGRAPFDDDEDEPRYRDRDRERSDRGDREDDEE